MPVESEIRTMLDALGAARKNPPKKITLEQSREIYRQQYLSMSRVPDEKVDEDVIPLPSSGHGVSMTLYRPRSISGSVAVILYLHGGGFVLGDSSTYAHQSARIALECNAIVAFLDYRLAPEHPFPAALQDTFSAVRWLVEHADDIGFDRDRFAIMGDSAGGNLAIAAMRRYREERFFRKGVLLYPVTDLRPYVNMTDYSASDRNFATGFFLERPAMEYFARSYLSDSALATDPEVSPVLATDLAGLPPISIYGGEVDLLRDQGRLFAERLKEVGNPVRYRCFEGLIHNFMQHSGISRKSDAAFLEACADLKAG